MPHEHEPQTELLSIHSRKVTDVAHKVVAVGSRSTESAQKFIDTYVNGDKSVKPYGSYAGVFADKVSGICIFRGMHCAIPPFY